MLLCLQKYIILSKASFFCYFASQRDAKKSSRRKLKLFANKIKIVREQFQKSSRTLSGLFANSFLIVLAESGKTLIILLLPDLKTRFLLPSFSLFFPSFLSSPLVLLVHTSYIVTNRNHRTVNERYLYADSNRIVSQRRLNKIIPPIHIEG